MESIFSFFGISALVNAVTSGGLGLYVLATSFRRRIARYLGFFCLSVAAWSVPYFLWQISISPDTALFWSRALMYGAILIPVSYFHMVLVFLGVDKERFYRIVLVIFYLFSALWMFLNTTPYFVVGVTERLGFEFWPQPGSFYFPFLIYFGSLVLYASVLLFKKYKQSKGSERNQTILLLTGIFLSFIGGSTNYFLWYNIPIAPWGNALVSLYVILTVYSIMKYGFLDLRVVAAEMFTGVLMLILFVDMLFEQSISGFLFRLVALTLVIPFGVMLVRSVRKQVQQREELGHLAESLKTANLRLQELDRQKTEFLSIASHQLRTPLSIIKGYIELIEDGAFGKVTKKTVKILDEMDESNERLVKLVDSFLDISRIEQGRTKYHFEEIAFNDLIDSVVKELTDRAEKKGLSIVWKRSSDVAQVNIDEEKIRHVIFNYVDNAIKYSETGKIRVTLERGQGSGKKQQDGIIVRVRDEGFGFDKKDQANFFQKFYRGENVVGTNVNGTGLGIYVCRKFVEAHQGEVWATSPGLGKGSEFGFWIPLVRDKKKEAALLAAVKK